MKTIVVSDLHLTDKFDPKKFDFLKQLISSCDRLIINGDLWCGSSTTFDKFLHSRWNQLFPLMLEKQTVYIPGNHDHHNFIDTGYKHFAVTLTHDFDLQNNDHNFLVTHGHQFIRITNKKKVNIRTAAKLHKIKRLFFHPANTIISKILAIRKIRRLLTSYNRLIIKRAKKFFSKDAIYIIGHTHLPEFKPDKGYINTGFIYAGLAWYLEITPTSFELVSARY